MTETIWGTPADPGHDAERGKLAAEGNGPPVASDAPLLPFLTLPANCDTAPETRVTVDSKQNPGVFVGETVHAVDAGGQPAPMTGCDGVPFAPKIASQPTTKLTSNPSGSGLRAEAAKPGPTQPRGTWPKPSPGRRSSPCPKG